MAIKNEVQRRDVLRGAALAVGAALLPGNVTAASRAPSLTRAEVVDHLQRAYFRELEALAENLKPGFLAGELHGYQEDKDMAPGGAAERIERACEEHFSLSEDSPWIDVYAIVAASPSADVVGADGWNHPYHHAVVSASYDVIRIARLRGWYVATDDESPPSKELGIA